MTFWLQQSSAHVSQEASALEDTEPGIEALGGCTLDAATDAGLQYIPSPVPQSPHQDVLQELLASLTAYASGTMPKANTPKSFLLAAGNPVGSTTSSITEIKRGNTPGAIEYFKAAQELQEDAFHCFSQLRDTSAVLNIQQQEALRCRWSVITGVSALPAGLSSWDQVSLCPDLQALAGVTRLYSGVALHLQRLLRMRE